MTSIFADVVWPALFLEQRLFSWWAIGLGLVVEFFFVRWLTTLSLRMCVVADLSMNAASALLAPSSFQLSASRGSISLASSSIRFLTSGLSIPALGQRLACLQFLLTAFWSGLCCDTHFDRRSVGECSGGFVPPTACRSLWPSAAYLCVHHRHENAEPDLCPELRPRAAVSRRRILRMLDSLPAPVPGGIR